MKDGMIIRNIERPWDFFQQVTHEIKIMEYPPVCHASRSMKRRIRSSYSRYWIVSWNTARRHDQITFFNRNVALKIPFRAFSNLEPCGTTICSALRLIDY